MPLDLLAITTDAPGTDNCSKLSIKTPHSEIVFSMVEMVIYRSLSNLKFKLVVVFNLFIIN